MDAEEFYVLRGDRSDTFLDSKSLLNQRVCVSAGRDAVTCKAGQQLLLNLSNQLSRLFNAIEFELDCDSALHAWSPFPEPTISASLVKLCSLVDPFGKFTCVASSAKKSIRIGVGDTDKDCDIYIGCQGWIAELSLDSSVRIADSESTLFGAALGSCIGAAAVTLLATNQNISARIISAWNYKEGDLAIDGPEWSSETDLGNILIIGAGAVGSCVAYWARSVGVNPDWAVMDKDIVKLHNTNRGLLFFPQQTAEYGRKEPRSKCDALREALPNLKVDNNWYHESQAITDNSFDLVVPVANEFQIRQLVSKRYMPVVLHATTGRNWLSQFHRHIIGKDDCIVCRMGEIEQKASFSCSEAPIDNSIGQKSGTSEGDAALPFLSAGSGILLLTYLVKLAIGQISDSPHNDIRLDFRSANRMASSGVRKCHEGCDSSAKLSLSKSIHAENKWIGALG